jgi:flagellar motor protein MotB
MKAFFNYLGWILFLVVAGWFLLFYNMSYLPRAERIMRQQQEIAMWTGQVEELTDSLKRVVASWDTVAQASFTWDELFGGADNLQLAKDGEAALRAYVPSLTATAGTIYVAGHTDNQPVPARVRDRYPSNFDLGAAHAGAVARFLVSVAVPVQRIVVIGAGEASPVGDNATAEGRAANRRVVVFVRNR